MAVTKNHPIKSTLKAALDYIMDKDKTDAKLWIRIKQMQKFLSRL